MGISEIAKCNPDLHLLINPSSNSTLSVLKCVSRTMLKQFYSFNDIIYEQNESDANGLTLFSKF